MSGKFYKNILEAIRDETRRIKEVIKEQRSSEDRSGQNNRKTG